MCTVVLFSEKNLSVNGSVQFKPMFFKDQQVFIYTYTCIDTHTHTHTHTRKRERENFPTGT